MEFTRGPVGHQGTREGFLEQVAQVAADRAGAWQGLVELLGEPDAEVVDRLRSGALVDLWRTGSGWLGDDSEVFTSVLMSLDVYVRGAGRRDPTADLAVYRDGHARHVGDGAALARRVEGLAEACRAESERWAAGDVAAGKTARAEQHAVLAAGLADELLAIGADAAQHASTHLWRTLGRLVLALVTVESGRDYQRAVLGDPRAARRRS